MNQAILGIDVGGTSAKAVVVTPDGSTIASGRAPTGRGEAALAAVRELAQSLVRDAARADATLAAAGIISPGVMDDTGRFVRFASNLQWRDLPLADLMETALGVPVSLANDATSAGLAEWRLGVARGVDNFVHISIGTGIGASLVVDGHLLMGARQAAGELGHISVVPDGEQCACGRIGCMDVYAAAAGMMRRYRAAGGDKASSVAELVAGVDTDPAAASVWSDALAALATGIVTVTMVTDPELVVLGGGVAGAGSALTEPLRVLVQQGLVWKTAPRLETTALGDRGGMAGALLVALSLLPADQRGQWTLEKLGSG